MDFYLVDKPAEWTSYDVIRVLKKQLKTSRIGHLGTLDPFATGLLVIAVGQATRLLPYLESLPKTYHAVFRFGATSTTGDPQGEITENPLAEMPGELEVEAAMLKFTGEIEQTPPAFSAVKVDGVRAYTLARAGKHVELKPRKVVISAFDRLDYEEPDLAVRIRCSRGTYIRSIATDLGKALGCGAYVTMLRREQIGPFHVERAVTGEALRLGRLSGFTALDALSAQLPMMQLRAADLAAVRHGRAIRGAASDERVGLVYGETLVAIAKCSGGQLHPEVVLSQTMEAPV